MDSSPTRLSERESYLFYLASPRRAAVERPRARALPRSAAEREDGARVHGNLKKPVGAGHVVARITERD